MTFALTTLEAALRRADRNPSSENMKHVNAALYQWLGVMGPKAGAEIEAGAVHDGFMHDVVGSIILAEEAEHDRVYIATKGGTDPWAAI